jgi:hypothetical protein
LLHHSDLLLPCSLFPSGSLSGLKFSFSLASPVERFLCERIMPGSFIVVVSGDFTEIGRHG